MDLLKQFLDASTGLAGEVISSLFVMGIVLILFLYVGIRARFADPLKKPKGLLFIATEGVKFFDDLVENMMGKRFDGFGGFVMVIATYLFIAFIWGLTGLPSPITNLAVPASLGLVTFVLIHATSVKYTKWKYFKRYIEPFPVFLPINLISMWAPFLSLTFRLFGNAVAGWVIMSLLYSGLQSLSGAIFPAISGGWNQIFIAPIITPVLHLYFDLFSGFIQTVVFIFLTMILISTEAPEEEIEEQLSVKGGR